LKRGDIYYANLPDPPEGSEQGLRRPALILQIDQYNKNANTIIIIPLTTSENENLAKLPSSVSIKKGFCGLNYNSVAICHQIRVVDKRRLDGKIGSVTTPIMNEIENAISIVLGLKLPNQ
jgi:mRNA interferase MazF